MCRRSGTSFTALLVALSSTGVGAGWPAVAAQDRDPSEPLASVPLEAPDTAASPDPAGEALASYAAGVRAFQRAAYDEAAPLFARADALHSSPNAKLMLARCYRLLGRPVEAYRVLERSVRQAQALDRERYAKTGEAARAELARVREQIGLVRVFVRSSGAAYLHVAGRLVPRDQWAVPQPVRPGTVKLSLETSPGRIEHREIEVAAGQRASIAVGEAPELGAAAALAAETRAPAEPPPAEERAGGAPLRAASLVVAGAGVASLVAFGALGALSSADYSELEAQCPGKTRCSPDLSPLAERGQTLQTAANVALAVGAAALGTSVVLFVLSDEPEVEASQLAVTPLGVRFGGTF